MPTIKNLSASMSSTSQLQGTCNTLELQLFSKLSKLDAVLNSVGEKVTEATFDDFNGDPDKLGKLKITEGGNESAWIKEVKTKVTRISS